MKENSELVENRPHFLELGWTSKDDRFLVSLLMNTYPCREDGFGKMNRYILEVY